MIIPDYPMQDTSEPSAPTPRRRFPTPEDAAIFIICMFVLICCVHTCNAQGHAQIKHRTPLFIPKEELNDTFEYGGEVDLQYVVSPSRFHITPDTSHSTAYPGTQASVTYNALRFTRECVILKEGHITYNGFRHPYKRLKIRKQGFIGSWKYITSNPTPDTLHKRFQDKVFVVHTPDGGTQIIWADEYRLNTKAVKGVGLQSYACFRNCKVGTVGNGKGFKHYSRYVIPKDWITIPHPMYK